jgi:dTDP-4-dehydrorhamnose 3,5-epimerase
MKFKETSLKGAYVIEPEQKTDERGFFARTFCRDEFKKHGLNPDISQCNMSYNKKKGTLRGMHYQSQPHGEVKVVSCIKGAIYDIIIDLRHDSPTYRQWVGVELTAENYLMLYVPVDFAHGYLTLEDNTIVTYRVSESYHPDFERGVRWNDLSFGIKWPLKPTVISDKDKNYPDYK